VGNRAEAWDGRDGSGGAGGDHGLFEDNGLLHAFHGDGVGSSELGVADKNVVAKVTAVPLHAVVRGDGRAEHAHALHDGAKVHADLPLWEDDSKPRAGLHIVHGSGAADDGLGGEAADVEAVAAHVVPFDESRALAQGLGTDDRQEASDSSANDDEVIGLLGRRVHALGRVNSRHSSSVVLVLGRHGDR